MRVLYVIDSLAPGGTEQSTIVLAPHLRELGFESTIVTLKSAEHDLTPEAEAAGITVQRLNSGRLPKRVRELRRLIRSGKFDVVHTALFDADQLGRVAAWGTGVPVVSSFVNTPYDPARLADPNVNKWKLRFVQLIDAVTGRLMVNRFHAVSEGAKVANARALRIPERRVTVAERGRDAGLLGERTDERRTASRVALGLGPDAQVVLNLGRQDYQKAQTVLIEAAALLSGSHPNLVVLIAGKHGSASADVQRALGEPLAARHVRLLGHRSDIGDLLCAADVLAISSHFEGTAGAAVEAMALSTPIVSTNLAGLQGVLEDGRNALLVPINSSQELANGLGRLLDDATVSSRLATRAHADFIERFTLNSAAVRLAELYGSVQKHLTTSPLVRPVDMSIRE
jgi:glycosyltransferase involved in cell wall biosynthesis|tara:strand:+ start:1032 stop:2225 length:1194 start_codon:yes stop_codon:yes gene_type:complete